jgi:hypothetical protein
MSILVDNASKFAEAFDCLVVFVHHAGKTADRGRGGRNPVESGSSATERNPRPLPDRVKMLLGIINDAVAAGGEFVDDDLNVPKKVRALRRKLLNHYAKIGWLLRGREKREPPSHGNQPRPHVAESARAHRIVRSLRVAAPLVMSATPATHLSPAGEGEAPTLLAAGATSAA